MRHRSIRAVFNYWNALRGNRPAPSRTEIDPRRIASELGDVFMLDGAAGDYCFRLAGSRIVASLGQPLTGKRFDTIWLDAARAPAQQALESPIVEGEPILIGIRAYEPVATEPKPTSVSSLRLQPRWPNLRQAGGTRPVERRGQLVGAGEMVLLPLTHQGTAGGRILGAMALFEAPTLPVTGPQPLDISGTRILGRTALPHQGPGLVSGDLTDTIIARHGHLVVIRGSGAPKDPASPDN